MRLVLLFIFAACQPAAAPLSQDAASLTAAPADPVAKAPSVDREKDCPFEAKDKATLPPVDPSVPAPALATGPVARIVFLDQKDACPCSRNRIDAGWKALESALGPTPAVPVERLFVDADKARADTYVAMYPLKRLPGVFMLNGEGQPVQVLSETIAPADVKAALGG
jgi:hypothetical protein